MSLLDSKKCQFCKEDFFRYKNSKENKNFSKQLFCSPQCSQLNQTGTKRPLVSLKRMGHIVSEETRRKIGEKNRIKLLGKKQTPEQIEKRVSQYRKEAHWNWHGGITSVDHLERLKFSKIMRKQILERDNYTCQMCGIRGGRLQVDHIQSWAEYVELRFEMNNCRTLCESCHYLITFGKPKPKNVKTWGHNFKELERMVN